MGQPACGVKLLVWAEQGRIPPAIAEKVARELGDCLVGGVSRSADVKRLSSRAPHAREDQPSLASEDPDANGGWQVRQLLAPAAKNRTRKRALPQPTRHDGRARRHTRQAGTGFGDPVAEGGATDGWPFRRAAACWPRAGARVRHAFAPCSAPSLRALARLFFKELLANCQVGNRNFSR